MGWKDMDYKERWTMVIAAVQSFAALGTFIAAIVGVWRVAPIITYQIQQQVLQQQKEAEQAAAAMPSSEVANRVVGDVMSWWTAQVRGYDRIMKLISTRKQRGLKVSFQLIETKAGDTAPDELIVTSTDAAGRKETVKVPVNSKAMTPTQYLQCKINQGAFAGLDAAPRQRVEAAVARYMNAYMLPKVPPPYIRADMSVQEVYDAIANHQERRVEAIKQIHALQGIIDDAVAG